MICLVNIDQAKAHHHIDDTDHDYDIESKIAQASEMVMNRLKFYAVPDEWILNTSPIVYQIPDKFQAYTLMIFSELYENREASVFSIQRILDLLDDDRMPTLA